MQHQERKEIPSLIETYKEGSVPDSREVYEQPFLYRDSEGDMVDVQKWVRYPNYDFIFGTPAVESEKYEKEFGFFAFRKMNKEKTNATVWTLYLDQSELEEMKEGFEAVLATSIAQRADEWKEHGDRQVEQWQNSNT